MPRTDTVRGFFDRPIRIRSWDSRIWKYHVGELASQLCSEHSWHKSSEIGRTRGTARPMVVAFASYGSPAEGPRYKTIPMALRADQRITLQPSAVPLPTYTPTPKLCLYFNKIEYDDLLQRVQQHKYPLLLSEELKDHIWDMTSGHPGAAKAFLLVLGLDDSLRNSRKDLKQVDLDEVLKILGICQR
ncbi:hypothetical protein MMC14_004990 [Varicellaria rhodocarpa]|nr:hypothetical protein [Varicellaria rhodocarpa]